MKFYSFKVDLPDGMNNGPLVWVGLARDMYGEVMGIRIVFRKGNALREYGVGRNV